MIDPRSDEKSLATSEPKGCKPWVARAIASGAFALPLAMSASSSPSPAHPVTFAWYRSLRQPWFKPPDALVPVAWTAIEAGLAGAAYRLLRTAPGAARSRALALLAWNVFAIGAWSRLFFGRRQLGASVVAAATMVATGAAFVSAAEPVDHAAARAGLPFVAWLGFATLLTAAIWRLNSARR